MEGWGDIGTFASPRHQCDNLDRLRVVLVCMGLITQATVRKGFLTSEVWDGSGLVLFCVQPQLLIM